MSMLITIGFIIVVVFIFYLWEKINTLQKHYEISNEITRLRIRPKNELFDLPLLREAMELDKKHHHTKFKVLSEKEGIKIGKMD
jgi:hypothetical protein